MNVYLIRISGTSYNFTIKAIVGPETEEELHKYCEEHLGLDYKASFGNRPYEIIDECSILRNKITEVSYSFSE